MIKIKDGPNTFNLTLSDDFLKWHKQPAICTIAAFLDSILPEVTSILLVEVNNVNRYVVKLGDVKHKLGLFTSETYLLEHYSMIIASNIYENWRQTND